VEASSLRRRCHRSPSRFTGTAGRRRSTSAEPSRCASASARATTRPCSSVASTRQRFVAGTWSLELERGEARLALRPLERLATATRRALEREGEALLRATQPAAKAHRVAVDDR